jgi:hypothetical protein
MATPSRAEAPQESDHFGSPESSLSRFSYPAQPYIQDFGANDDVVDASSMLSINAESPTSDEMDSSVRVESWHDRGNLLVSLYFLTKNYRPGLLCHYEGAERIRLILMKFFPQIRWTTDVLADLYIFNQEFSYQEILDAALVRNGAVTQYDLATARATSQAQQEYSSKIHGQLTRWGKMIKTSQENRGTAAVASKALLDFDLSQEKQSIFYTDGQLLSVPYSPGKFKLMVGSGRGTWNPDEYRSWLYGHHNFTITSTGYPHPITRLPQPVDWPRLTQRWNTSAEAHILYEYLKRAVISKPSARRDDETSTLVKLSAALTSHLGGDEDQLAVLQGLPTYTPFL